MIFSPSLSLSFLLPLFPSPFFPFRLYYAVLFLRGCYTLLTFLILGISVQNKYPEMSTTYSVPTPYTEPLFCGWVPQDPCLLVWTLLTHLPYYSSTICCHPLIKIKGTFSFSLSVVRFFFFFWFFSCIWNLLVNLPRARVMTRKDF